MNARTDTPARPCPFTGRTAWITGASSGIGAALALEFAARGARIILSGRNQERLNAVAATLPTPALILPFEVTDDAALAQATGRAIAAAAEWGGGVDLFVANAGVSQRSAARDTAMAVYRRIIDVDLTAQIAATQALLPHLAARADGGQPGALVFISSIAGKVGVPMRTAYCAAKFGLIGYADALRAELSPSGIAVHVVCPGSVATDVSRNALTADGQPRGRSDPAIDSGIPADEAARAIADGMAAGTREIIVARGGEQAMGELRRTPDALLDQVADMVARGYMTRMEAEG